MRINRFVARATGMSRRAADQVVASGRVTINSQPAATGSSVPPGGEVKLDGKVIKLAETTTMMLNKPVGYIVSKAGQGSKTIYDLLPDAYHRLKPVGRLDKDSSGLLLLTNDGELANQLTHPRYAKTKVYEIELSKPLEATDQEQVENGVSLDDGSSKLALNGQGTRWQVTMSEGRNRQIRRTFEALGYTVTKLHRTRFGSYSLGDLRSGAWAPAQPPAVSS